VGIGLSGYQYREASHREGTRRSCYYLISCCHDILHPDFLML
jgi:hypothetical protein